MTDLPPPASQAEAMIRRVSPEGRARAHKERQRRQRARWRLVGRVLAAWLAILVAAGLLQRLFGPTGTAGLIATLVACAVAAVAIVYGTRERPATSTALAGTELRLLPAQTVAWLDREQAALPAPAARLVDGIGLRLDAMAAPLAALDPAAPAAAAVRKLLAVELPELLAGYRRIPAPLRAQPPADGGGTRSPDAHLIHGLGVVDAEIARMTEQLARGAYDELAVQHRYLELKYDPAADRI